MRKLARILRGGEAAEIAEAAMVLPLVFMFLLGIVWFGRAFNIYSTITQAAQQGAVTAARPACATCLPGTGWSGNASFPSDATVGNAVVPFSRLRVLTRTISPQRPTQACLPARRLRRRTGGACNRRSLQHLRFAGRYC